MIRHLAILCLFPIAAATAQDRPESDPARRAVAIERAVMQIAGETALWPGYRPELVPLAIFTGDRTFLFRHPSPPEEFVTADGLAAMPGRHPAVTSNSSATIGGVATATLLADGARGDRPVRALAAVALHEAFHVHQRARHPGWQGNEGDLFTYPVDRADLLTARRSESEHLHRALDAAGRQRSCHVRSALVHRRARFAGMSTAHVEYERRSELNEGLATYVQLRAAGERTVTFPREPFAPDAVRERFYVVGPALALLLDDARPGWQGELTQHDSLALDVLLWEALPPPDPATICTLADTTMTAIADRARRDVAAVTSLRAELRTAFEHTPGWRIVVEAADGAPLWPQGFDPLNVTLVADGLLHHRFVTLGNDAGQISMVDGETADLAALTVAAGEHPLFSGVKRLTVVGLVEPVARRLDSTLEIVAPGLTLSFRDARLVEQGRTLIIRLGAGAADRP